jgi:integrase
MNLVAYSSDPDSLQQIRLYALLNGHRIVACCDYEVSRTYVLKEVYAKAEGLILQNISHITRDTEFLISLDELKQRGKHLICIADSIDTTRPGGETLWLGLQSIARESRVAKITKRSEQRTTKRKERKTAPQPEPDQPTLRQTWTDFRRSRQLSANTLTTYDQHLRINFGDWLDRPLVSITKNHIESRHRDLTLNKGPTTANLACRVLRSVLNYARIKYEKEDGSPLFAINPVSRLTELRAWNREKPRETYISVYQYRDWWQAVEAELYRTGRDFLIFLALTGCRRSEATGLKWADVNFTASQVTFRDTKNHSDHTIPVCAYVLAMLTERHTAPGRSENVFTSLRGAPYEI